MTDVTLRPGEFTLSVGIDKVDVLTFDCSGRPLAVFLDEKTYKRGLDNRILMVWREKKNGSKVRSRRYLAASEAKNLLYRIHKTMTSVNQKLASGEVEVVQSAIGEVYPLEKLRNWMDRILTLQPSLLEKDKERFSSVYKPVGILPPDQYLSIVLQGTEGCSYNKCTFCNFYRNIDFRIKSPEEFSQHIDAVKEFLGSAIGLRKAIFLADANAMAIPREKLIPMVEMITKEFPIIPNGKDRTGLYSEGMTAHTYQGIYSFIDSFSGPMKDVRDFVELRELSLRRLYLGLESGNDNLLRFLEKPGTTRDVLTLVRRIKKAGIRLGVIVMAGIGGDKFARDHLEDTVAISKAMKLGKGDILYISDFLAHPDSEYIERSSVDGIKPLVDEEITAQRMTITNSLLPEARKNGFKIAPYNIRDYIY
jgi:radical SAM superfamily enzyme YgiQ (UPF0313 family)